MHLRRKENEMNELTLYFSEFDIPGNHALGLYRALDACRERGARRLLFDVPGEYELDPSFCAERNLCISNHGFTVRTALPCCREHGRSLK